MEDQDLLHLRRFSQARAPGEALRHSRQPGTHRFAQGLGGIRQPAGPWPCFSVLRWRMGSSLDRDRARLFESVPRVLRWLCRLLLAESDPCARLFQDTRLAHSACVPGRENTMTVLLVRSLYALVIICGCVAAYFALRAFVLRRAGGQQGSLAGLFRGSRRCPFYDTRLRGLQGRAKAGACRVEAPSGGPSSDHRDRRHGQTRPCPDVECLERADNIILDPDEHGPYT